MRNKVKITGLLTAILILGACTPINTEFSCHQTAKDRCLSIEKVHALTESAGNTSTIKEQTMWIAPWVDAEGLSHRGSQTLALSSGG
jgi:hypothetical protein